MKQTIITLLILLICTGQLSYAYGAEIIPVRMLMSNQQIPHETAHILMNAPLSMQDKKAIAKQFTENQKNLLLNDTIIKRTLMLQSIETLLRKHIESENARLLLAVSA